jgi:hypothetical protein
MYFQRTPNKIMLMLSAVVWYFIVFQASLGRARLVPFSRPVSAVHFFSPAASPLIAQNYRYAIQFLPVHFYFFASHIAHIFCCGQA